MVRVGQDGRSAALLEPHVRPMEFAGKALSGFVLVDPGGFASDAALAAWSSAASTSRPRSRRSAGDETAQSATEAASPRALRSGHAYLVDTGLNGRVRPGVLRKELDGDVVPASVPGRWYVSSCQCGAWLVPSPLTVSAVASGDPFGPVSRTTKPSAAVAPAPSPTQ